MTTGVNSGAVLAQAKQIHQTTSSSLKKETKLEKEDMTKYQSIFKKAENILVQAEAKGVKTKDIAEQKIQAQKDIAQAQVDMYNEYYKKKQELTKQREEALRKQEEAKKELTDDQRELVKNSNIDKLLGNSFKKEQKTITIQVPGKMNTQNISGKGKTKDAEKSPGIQNKTIKYDVYIQDDSKSAQINSGNNDAMSKYLEATKNLANIDAQLQPIDAKITPIQAQLASVSESISSIGTELENNISTINTNTGQNITNQLNEMSQIESKQSTSSLTNSNNSQSASNMAQIANNTAAQANNNDPNKNQLTQIAEKLNTVSKDSSSLSNKNKSNAQMVGTDKSYITEENNNLATNSLNSTQSLKQEYTQYITDTIKPCLTENQASNLEGTLSATGSGGKDGKIDKVTSSLPGKAASASQGIINGDSIASTVMNVGMSFASEALDKVIPGLSSGLSIISSIFG